MGLKAHPFLRKFADKKNHIRAFLLANTYPMRKILFLLPALILLIGSTVVAQDSYKINYEIELVDTGEMDEMTAAMMQDMTMMLAFEGELSRVDMNMSMMNMSTRMNASQKKGIVLMEMMGMKTATMTDEEAFDESKQPEVDVRKTGKTKSIAGYKCQQAFVKAKDATEEQEVWYTDKIKIQGTGTDYTYQGLDGFPLEMIVDDGQMKMRMTATSVSTDKMGSDYFSTAVPAGYTIQEEPLMGE